MPAAGYTPILLYGSATASAVPAAANLTNGTGGSEIAINITDGRLYYKDNNGAVQLIGAKLNSTLAAAMGTAPTGTGAVVLATGPTLTLPNATGLPLTTGVTGVLPIANGGTNASTAPAALTALGAAALAGSATQVFNVANATTPSEAVNLGQAQADFAALAGSASQPFNVANAATSTQAVNLGQMIGGGATQYADVTGSRALSATYTNTTGRPLVVCVVGEALVNLSALCELNGYVDGNLSMVSSIVNSTGSASTTFYPSIMLIVPPGGTYSASATASVIIFKWLEY